MGLKRPENLTAPRQLAEEALPEATGGEKCDPDHPCVAPFAAL
jgi:hypothetical protein